MTDDERAIINRLTSAAHIAPSEIVYEVVRCEGHKTLVEGDLVIMRETPNLDNVFLRTSDLTIHAIATECGYVQCFATKYAR
jgi:hypothetical protein